VEKFRMATGGPFVSRFFCEWGWNYARPWRSYALSECFL